MKKLLPLFVLVGLLLGLASGTALANPTGFSATTPLFASSTPVTHGPYGGSILQLTNDPTSDAGIYAAVRDVGLFHSADAGASWAFLFSGIGAQGNFAIDATDANTLYVTRPNEGLYVSRDGGQTWQAIPLHNDLGDMQVYSVRAFAHPTVTGKVFAALSYADPGECGSDCGLYVSSDYGAHWMHLSSSPIPNDAKINALAFFPLTPAVIFAGTDDGQIYRSSDDGQTWVSQEQSMTHISKLVMVGSNLYAIRSGEGVSMPAVRCTGADTSFIDCETETGLDYLIIDPGSAPEDAPNEVTDLKVDPISESHMLVSTGYRVARSTDGGVNWAFYATASSPSQSSAVLFDPASADTIYAGNNQGFWKTSGGSAGVPATATWVESNEQLAGVVPHYIHAAPSAPQVVYVNSNAGLYRSADGSNSWERLPLFCEVDWCYHLDTPFAIDPSDADNLVLAAWNYTVQVSDDGGQTWSTASLPIPDPLAPLKGSEYTVDIQALIAIPGSPNVYLAAVIFHDWEERDNKLKAGGGIYRSVDGGSTWSLVEKSTEWAGLSAAYDPSDPARVYVGTCVLAANQCAQAGVLVSDDQGASWNVLVPTDTTLQVAMEGNAIAVRPTDGRLYLANGYSVLWIDKGGSQWTEWSGFSEPIRALLFDPAAASGGRKVFGAGETGLYVSETAGETFERYEGGLGYANVTAMGSARDQDDVNFVFVGTAGGQFAEPDNAPASVADTLVEAGVYRMTDKDYFTYLPAVIR